MKTHLAGLACHGAILIALATTGCSPAPQDGGATSDGEGSAAAAISAGPEAISAGPEAAAPPGKMKFKNGADEPVLSFKWYEDGGAKLVDGQETELARYTWKDGKLKIKDAGDEVLGFVTGTDPSYRVEAPDQVTTLFKLQRQDDGDWKLEDADGSLICRLKRRAYGIEIEGPDDRRIATAKKKGDKVAVRDPDENVLFATKDAASVEAVACLGLSAVESTALRGALFVRMEKRSRGEP